MTAVPPPGAPRAHDRPHPVDRRSHDRRDPAEHDEPVDRPQPAFVGHPALKYPVLALVVASVAAWAFLDDRALVAVGAPTMVLLGVLTVVFSVLRWRGTLRPLPPRRLVVYPPAGVVGGIGMVVGASAVFTVILSSDERGGPVLLPGLAAAGVLYAVAVVLHLLSLADTWPERWKPPDARSVGQPGRSGDADRVER